MDLQELGFTKEELQNRVVNRICEELMTRTRGDDPENPGYEWAEESGFRKELDKQIMEGIKASIQRLAEEHVLPNVSKYVEETCLQETSKWGEKRGDPMTFTEYLVAKAEQYLMEKVDYSGKAKSEDRGYSWSGTQTRITHLVHKHLHHSISHAMEDAVKSANSAITAGIQETVKIKLAEVAEKLQVTTKIK